MLGLVSISILLRLLDHLLYAQLAHGESCFVYTGGFGSSSQYIGFVGYVIGGSKASDLIEETV